MIEIIEIIHAPFAHVMREVVYLHETDALGQARHRLHQEIDVVDGGTGMAVHQVDEAAADAPRSPEY